MTRNERRAMRIIAILLFGGAALGFVAGWHSHRAWVEQTGSAAHGRR